MLGCVMVRAQVVCVARRSPTLACARLSRRFCSNRTTRVPGLVGESSLDQACKQRATFKRKNEGRYSSAGTRVPGRGYSVRVTDVSSPRFGEARGEGAPKCVVLLVVHEPDSDGTVRAKRACGFEGADALPLAPPGCFLESVTSVLVPVPAPRPHCQHTASPHCELN